MSLPAAPAPLLPRPCRLALAVAGGAIALAVAAPPASALSVTLESPVEGAEAAVVEIVDDEGDANDVTVRVEGEELVVTDPGATRVRALSGCTGPLGGLTVRCPVPGEVRINTQALDDRVTVETDVYTEIFGGDGNDTLSGGRLIDGQGGDDAITGTGLDDVLTGGPGADTIGAGAGNDVIREGAELEADRLDGGEGVDTLDYSGRPTQVVADLGPAAQSAGAAGEGDTVAGFERVLGGAVGDRIRIGVPSALTDGATGAALPLAAGNRGDDRIELYGAAAGLVLGGSGDDVLTGGRGDDRLVGGPGEDRLSGAGGDDTLEGGVSPDVLTGGGGNDRLLPGPGRDRVSGGAGRDTILARDRVRDVLTGGPGRDRAVADRIDRTSGVERLTRRR